MFYDLEQYFEKFFLGNYPESRIAPLSKEKAIKLHNELKEYDPIIEELGLIPLDDANDSNPYCFVSKTPMKGSIFHYSHDGDRLFKFSNISNWMKSMSQAGSLGIDIDEIKYEGRVECTDIDALCEYIESNYDENCKYYSEATVYLIQGLNEDCIGLLGKLASNEDFFIREGVAELISRKPAIKLKEIAFELSNDKYDQVAYPAKIALKKINSTI